MSSTRVRYSDRRHPNGWEPLAHTGHFRFWQRFLDDCIGVWRGTKRSFINFVNQLNTETMKHVIKFPTNNEVRFDKSVHFLDLSVYLDETIPSATAGTPNQLNRRQTLSQPQYSFDPRSVFNSIPFSQMLRTLRNNSKDETQNIELIVLRNQQLQVNKPDCNGIKNNQKNKHN